MGVFPLINFILNGLLYLTSNSYSSELLSVFVGASHQAQPSYAFGGVLGELCGHLLADVHTLLLPTDVDSLCQDCLEHLVFET